MTLEQRWTVAWEDLAIPPPPRSVLDSLLAAYAEPTRAYHNARHLEECFTALDPVRHLASSPGAVALALWFHDAVYDTRSFRNEEESADWASEVLESAKATDGVQDTVRSLILATRHGGPDAEAGGDQAAPPRDAALVVDIDLAILGALPTRFAEYEDEIRREFAWVPGFLFRRERGRVLRSFVERPHVYRTEAFRASHEEQARSNLLGAIARLGD